MMVVRIAAFGFGAFAFAACTVPAHFLGAPVPDACASRDVDDCAFSSSQVNLILTGWTT